MVYTADLKSAARKGIRVRVPSLVPNIMNKSPERGTFHSRCKIEDVIKEGGDPDHDEDVQRALDLEQMINDHKAQREVNEQWRENNLEYDLRSTEWVCVKAKASDIYAQNIYAALCNQDWQKNEVWPLLKGETYSCSWRYAGGIVADMREEGDYINWYCSGIGDGLGNHDAEGVKGYVPEGYVTEEIREDFFKLGWIPADSSDE
jgi:hypothetical protein